MSKLPRFEGEAYGMRRHGCPTCRNTGPSNRVTRLTRGAFFLSEDTDKARIREEALRARLKVPSAVRAERSSQASQRLLALPAITAARTVAFYAAVGSEADPAVATRACLEAGKRVVFPRVTHGRRMEFAAARLDELVPGPRGTLQPPGDCAAVPLQDIDCIVVPGVAFDAAGGRLGRGGGYYDATLSELPASAARIGFAFDQQIVPFVPSEQHDVAMHVVVTDSRVLVAAPIAAAASH